MIFGGLNFYQVQWAYLGSLGLKLWLCGLVPPGTDSWLSCAGFSISSRKPIAFCFSFSRAICSCWSFSSFLCCTMICCWTVRLVSTSTLCRASWSSATVGAAWRRVTCHGWNGRDAVLSEVLFWCTAQSPGAKVLNLWRSFNRANNRPEMRGLYMEISN